MLTALANGVPQGITDAIHQLEDPSNYQIPSITSIVQGFSGSVDALYLQGQIDTPDPTLLQLLGGVAAAGGFPVSDVTLSSSPADIINDLTATVSADYSALLPLADSVTALFTSLPTFDASIFVDQLQHGDLLGAIGLPIAADLGLAPILFGVGFGEPIADGVAGTFADLATLFS